MYVMLHNKITIKCVIAERVLQVIINLNLQISYDEPLVHIAAAGFLFAILLVRHS